MNTYLALGDSYTIGEGVETHSNFPHLLVRHLKEQYDLEFSAPDIIATTGWTTGELIEGISGRSPLQQYDMTTLLIGVNNQYRGQDIGVFIKEFTQLLYTAILHTRKGAAHVFVISIPDWGVTPFAHDRDSSRIAQEIAAYNKLKRSVATMNKCRFIDITPESIQNGSDPSYLVADGLHYSEKAYRNWVKIIAPAVAAAFQNPSSKA